MQASTPLISNLAESLIEVISSGGLVTTYRIKNTDKTFTNHGPLRTNKELSAYAEESLYFHVIPALSDSDEKSKGEATKQLEVLKILYSELIKIEPKLKIHLDKIESLTKDQELFICLGHCSEGFIYRSTNPVLCFYSKIDINKGERDVNIYDIAKEQYKICYDMENKPDKDYQKRLIFLRQVFTTLGSFENSKKYLGFVTQKLHDLNSKQKKSKSESAKKTQKSDKVEMKRDDTNIGERNKNLELYLASSFQRSGKPLLKNGYFNVDKSTSQNLTDTRSSSQPSVPFS